MNTEKNHNKAEKQATVSVSVTDLRIGNLIHYNGNHEEIGKISLLVPDVIDVLSYCQINYRRDKKHWLINLHPVKITEEWLIEFGFVKKDKTWDDKSISTGLFFKDRYFIENSKEGFLFCQSHYSGNCWFLKNIKYIHQLQNLFFALTGSEL